MLPCVLYSEFGQNWYNNDLDKQELDIRPLTNVI